RRVGGSITQEFTPPPLRDEENKDLKRERNYPEQPPTIPHAIRGYQVDMNSNRCLACHSRANSARTQAPMISITHFTDRDSHFIFGDVATAILVEDEAFAPAKHWKILGTKLKTQFSNNIRNNFGFLNRAAPEGAGAPDKLFVQEGRKVFKEVVPMVAEMITAHLGELGLKADALKRMWLHQANANMNRLISSKVLGHEASETESPTVLDTYANTSSAGSIIAFHLHSEDFAPGEKGLICSFGAGYSAGTVFVEKVGG
ncbi:MAG: hypothetical protein B7Z22_04480, partial [Hyphomonas sp. 32-62-5]